MHEVCRCTQCLVNAELGRFLAKRYGGEGMSKHELASELETIAKQHTVWRTLSCPEIPFANELMYPPELIILKEALQTETDRVCLKYAPELVTHFVLSTLDDHAKRSERLSSELNRLLETRSRGRQLGTIDDGQLGLFPGSSKVGDSVWILSGARVPFVLRGDESGGLRLVGEAYIHGVMHGKAVSETTILQDVCIS